MQEYIAHSFSVLTDRGEVNAEKVKGNIFLHNDRPTQLIRTLLPYLQIPTTSLKKLDPTQQNSLAKSSCELISTLLVYGD